MTARRTYRGGSVPEPAEVIRSKIATRKARLERYRAVFRTARGRRLRELLTALSQLTPDELLVVSAGEALLRTAIETERITVWRLERRLRTREGVSRESVAEYVAAPESEAGA